MPGEGRSWSRGPSEKREGGGGDERWIKEEDRILIESAFRELKELDLELFGMGARLNGFMQAQKYFNFGTKTFSFKTPSPHPKRMTKVSSLSVAKTRSMILLSFS